MSSAFYNQRGWSGNDAVPPTEGIAVDVSTKPTNPGPTEYRAVDIATGRVLFWKEIGEATNNIGEFCAIIEALQRDPNATVYSDSKIAIHWTNAARANSSFYFDRKKPAYEAYAKAVTWIRQNPNAAWRVKFWSVREWGENPADFGYKIA
jgi:ribonuclease HI